MTLFVTLVAIFWTPDTLSRPVSAHLRSGSPHRTLISRAASHTSLMLRTEPGTLSMANTGSPNSGGSQFFINTVREYSPHSPPHVDGAKQRVMVTKLVVFTQNRPEIGRKQTENYFPCSSLAFCNTSLRDWLCFQITTSSTGSTLRHPPPTQSSVSFQWKNPCFLLKNVDFLLKKLDFLLKNDDFIIKQPRSRRAWMLSTRSTTPPPHRIDRMFRL